MMVKRGLNGARRIGALKSEAEGASGVIESAFVDSGASVRSWTEQAIVRGALSFDAYEKSDAVFQTLQKRYPQFKAIVLFKPDGTPVSSNDPVNLDKFAKLADATEKSPWFQAAMNRASPPMRITSGSSLNRCISGAPNSPKTSPTLLISTMQ